MPAYPHSDLDIRDVDPESRRHMPLARTPPTHPCHTVLYNPFTGQARRNREIAHKASWMKMLRAQQARLVSPPRAGGAPCPQPSLQTSQQTVENGVLLERRIDNEVPRRLKLRLIEETLANQAMILHTLGFHAIQ